MHRSCQPPCRSRFRKFLLLLLATICPLAAADPRPAEILKDMQRVADWQLANPSKHKIHDWTQAPFFLGLANLYQVSGEAKYLEALDSFGKQLGYGPGPRVTHADDHAVLQAWLEEYRMDKDPAKLKPSIEHFDKVTAALANEGSKSISGVSFTWCWCDALFMSPAVWTHLSQLTGEPKYFAWADREWWTTTDVLYDPTHHLYYRDNNFFTKRTPSGKKVFWSRGNGWVTGGLVHVLDYLPEKHPTDRDVRVRAENRRLARQAGHRRGLYRSLWLRRISASRCGSDPPAGAIEAPHRPGDVQGREVAAKFPASHAVRVRPLRAGASG